MRRTAPELRRDAYDAVTPGVVERLTRATGGRATSDQRSPSEQRPQRGRTRAAQGAGPAAGRDEPWVQVRYRVLALKGRHKGPPIGARCVAPSGQGCLVRIEPRARPGSRRGSALGCPCVTPSGRRAAGLHCPSVRPARSSVRLRYCTAPADHENVPAAAPDTGSRGRRRRTRRAHARRPPGRRSRGSVIAVGRRCRSARVGRPRVAPPDERPAGRAGGTGHFSSRGKR